jgi:hypothetical protein
MPGEYDPLLEEENIKSENDFLKMKIMLEHGADIQFSGNHSVGIENDLLKCIMAFESHKANPVYITVYKKIGSPDQFRPVREIAGSDMETALQNLMEYMHEHGIGLGCCRPNVSAAEMYRFIVEELFEKEIADMDMPGMMTSFIYDEFYPDHKYDNTILATDDCIRLILSKKPFDFSPHFDDEDLQLNNYTHLSEDDLKAIINRFKKSFDDIHLLKVISESCVILENLCTVKGKYLAELISGDRLLTVEDDWMVELRFREDYGYWYMANVQLNGIEI